MDRPRTIGAPRQLGRGHAILTNHPWATLRVHSEGGSVAAESRQGDATQALVVLRFGSPEGDALLAAWMTSTLRSDSIRDQSVET
jgi:hypothetical protein